MVFKHILAESAEDIDKHLDAFFTKWTSETAEISSHLRLLVQVLWDACKGGKRVRGALIHFGYTLAHKDGANKLSPSEILSIAVAYEIFQTAILIHDDIIDKSQTRRGKPTVYTQLGGDHYGVSQAICIGDLGFFLAFRLLSEASIDAEIKNKVIAFFSNSTMQTVLGEMLDVEFAFKKELANQEDILTIYRYKTAYYTIVAPLTLGAILAGADEKLISKLKVYGEHVGITFQVQDDCTDIFGATSNKDLAGDIREGKDTLLYHEAKALANAEQMSILEKYYGKSTVTDPEIVAIQKVFREIGVLDTSLAFAQEQSDKAKAVVPEITEHKEQQGVLVELADLFVEKIKILV